MKILSRLRTEPDSLGAGCALLTFCFGLRIVGEVPYIAATTGRHALFALLEYDDSYVVL